MPMVIDNIPKSLLRNLRNYPRDIFFSFEAIAAPRNIDVPIDFYGYGLDIICTNTGAVNTVLLIDKTWIVTIPAGQTFSLDNVLYYRIEVTAVGAANLYGAGVTKRLMGVM